jgi:hypothetical protein
VADLRSTDNLFDSYLNRSQPFTFHKDVTMVGTNDQIWSQWLGVGRPEAGVAPSTPAVPTSQTVGALARFTNPTAGETLRLQKFDAISFNTTSALTMYDRVSHMGGLSGNITTLQNVNTAAIDRGDLDGIGVIGFLECYTAMGATPRTVTILYTNHLNQSGRTGTVVIPATMVASRLVQITLQAGDLWIKSVESAQLLVGGTGTAGNFGITLARYVKGFAVGVQGQTNVPIRRSGLKLGSPIIEPDACLWMVLRTLGGGGGDHRGGFTLVSSG